MRGSWNSQCIYYHTGVEYANTFKIERRPCRLGAGDPYRDYPHLVCRSCHIQPVPIIFKDDTNVFTNYANPPASAPGNFYDCSSTTHVSLLTSTVYRASLMLNQEAYIQ